MSQFDMKLPWQHGSRAGYNAGKIFDQADDCVAEVYGFPIHQKVADVKAERYTKELAKLEFVLAAVNSYEPNKAIIAKLTEALELAAGRLHWAGTAEPGAASKPGKTLILTWEQEAREALALAKAGRTA